MKRSFPKQIERYKHCSFTVENLRENSVSDYTIVKEYLHGRFDLIDYVEVYNETKMAGLAFRVIKAFQAISLDSIKEMIKNEDCEICTSDRVPLLYNLEDPLFSELSLLYNGPLDYETLGDLLPGCNADSSESKYKYGEVCSKILALLDLVWIYKDDKTKVMLSPMGSAFRKMSLQERCVLFRKLLFKLELIRNIVRNSEGGRYNSEFEVSKWVNGSTITRRCQSVNLLLKEID